MAAGGSDEHAANLDRWNDQSVVAAYRSAEGLMADEQELLDRFVPPGGDLLDLGIGTGRTTGPLAARAGRYVGVDYAPGMVRAAQDRHPGLDLRVGDASDLHEHPSASFDAVVFSYNGLDYLHPDDRRRRCLTEVRRVLRPEGVLLLARHNPRALLTPPPAGARPRGVAIAAVGSARRTRRLLPTSAFRTGEGYVQEPFKGGLIHHMATPRRVVAEVEARGFTHLATLGARSRRRTPVAWTPWFSYAFRAAR